MSAQKPGCLQAASQVTACLPRTPDDISPAWLTLALRSQGHLPEGAVQSLEREIADKTWNVARTAFLSLTYTRTAPKTAPGKLFVKMRHVRDPFDDIVSGEFAFYRDAPRQGLPIAPCYGAFSDEDGTASVILLADLSDSHHQTQWPLPPSKSECESAVTALAAIHSHWWCRNPDHLTYESLSHPGMTLQQRTRNLETYLEKLVPAFLKELGEHLTPRRRAVMTRVCGALPDLLCQRLSGPLPVTRINGDPHCWNFFFGSNPKDPACLIIDWEDWHYHPGAFDLAYMMALQWFPDRRRQLELPLLDTYYQALPAGIRQYYNKAQLLADYRLGHLHNFVVPCFQLAMGIGPASWWDALERLFLAYDDLDCQALLPR